MTILDDICTMQDHFKFAGMHGIGRQVGLKTQCPKGRGSSNLPSRTRKDCKMKVRVTTYSEPEVGITAHTFTINLGFKDFTHLAEEDIHNEANRILLLIEKCFTEVYCEPCSAEYVEEDPHSDGLEKIFPESTLGRLFTDGSEYENGVKYHKNGKVINRAYT